MPDMGMMRETTGGALRLGRELTEYLRGDLIYRIDLVDISNTSSNASADLEAERAKLISKIIPLLHLIVGIMYLIRIEGIFLPVQ